MALRYTNAAAVPRYDSPLSGLIPGYEYGRQKRLEDDSADAFSEYIGGLNTGQRGMSIDSLSPASYAPSSAPDMVGQSHANANAAVNPETASGLDAYIANARQAESGGNPNARNPNSSATGLYQFTEGTWNDLARQQPNLGLTPDGRTDPAQQERAMRAFTQGNAQSLSGAGLPVNPGNLYAAHFLGAGGATQVLGMADETPMVAAVSPEVIQANPFLADMTVGDFRQWSAEKGGGSGGGYSAPRMPQQGLRPFRPGEFVDNDGSDPRWSVGSRSTERTITWQMPDGRWVNSPTLFMGPNGVVDLSQPNQEPEARQAAMSIMQQGVTFPTFNSERDASAAAQSRSNRGGAFQGSIGTNGAQGQQMPSREQMRALFANPETRQFAIDLAKQMQGGGATGGDPTSNMREYQLARQQGFQGSFMDFVDRNEGGDNSAAEQRIARLSENLMATGDFADPAQARNIAVGIVDGRLKTDRHPVTGQLQIVDMATGQPVYQAQNDQPAPQAEPQTPAEAPPNPYPAADRAFGVEGAARGGINSLADTAGIGAVDPELQETQAGFAVLKESLLNDIASAYDRQPPSWLMQEIRNLTPTAGSPFEGSGGAQAKLGAIKRHMENELAFARESLGRELSPTNRQEAETRVSHLEMGLSRVDQAINAFGQQGSDVPPAALEMLRQDPSEEARQEFDQVFGEGAANRALGGN